MNRKKTGNMRMIASIVLWACHSAQCQNATNNVPETVATLSVKAVPYPRTKATDGGTNWGPFLYGLRAGGSQSFVSITNTPESNHARIFFKRWGLDSPGSRKRLKILGPEDEK